MESAVRLLQYTVIGLSTLDILGWKDTGKEGGYDCPHDSSLSGCGTLLYCTRMGKTLRYSLKSDASKCLKLCVFETGDIGYGDTAGRADW